MIEWGFRYEQTECPMCDVLLCLSLPYRGYLPTKADRNYNNDNKIAHGNWYTSFLKIAQPMEAKRYQLNQSHLHLPSALENKYIRASTETFSYLSSAHDLYKETRMIFFLFRAN